MKVWEPRRMFLGREHYTICRSASSITFLHIPFQLICSYLFNNNSSTMQLHASSETNKKIYIISIFVLLIRETMETTHANNTEHLFGITYVWYIWSSLAWIQLKQRENIVSNLLLGKIMNILSSARKCCSKSFTTIG